MGHLQAEQANKYLQQFWDEQITPTLVDYIRIANVSPAFDPDWKKNGHMDSAKELALSWLKEHQPKGSKIIVDEQPGRTPILFLEVEGDSEDTVLLYGHFDKQPEMTGWMEGFGPWQPVLHEDKLYGRGGADDGYAMFAAVAAIRALQEQNISLPRLVVLIEFSEESGSPDLPFYCDHYRDLIGEVSLVVCLDSGALNYDQMWLTTSLRGMLSLIVRVDTLTEGVHSGDSSGALPSSFRVLRALLDRLEDAETGSFKLKELYVDIPDNRREQAKQVANVLGEGVFTEYPTVTGLAPVSANWDEFILLKNWYPSLSYISSEGMPTPLKAGNVLRPFTSLGLSFRLPPTLAAEQVAAKIKTLLTENPPYGAKVTVEINGMASGWNAPEERPWFRQLMDDCSVQWFGKPALYTGQGGSIPFMTMLGERFPDADFVITGVLGPKSNAHGPNEFLHLPFAKKLTGCIAQILADVRDYKQRS